MYLFELVEDYLVVRHYMNEINLYQEMALEHRSQENGKCLVPLSRFGIFIFNTFSGGSVSKRSGSTG